MRSDSSKLFLSTFKLTASTCRALAIGLTLLIFATPALASGRDIEVVRDALRGFIAVAYPDGGANRCEIREASSIEFHKSDSYRKWYFVAIESLCPGEDVAVSTVWIVCADRGTIACSIISAPPRSDN